MRRSILCLALLALAVPGLCEKKINVAQLEDLLRSLKQDHKSDSEIAATLKQVELTEQLTLSVKNSLLGLANGPLATETIYVLEARSADLLPPPSDLPGAPAPDEAAQKAILERAEAYVARTYERLPPLVVTKTTLRFQDNMEALASSSGINSGAKEVITTSGHSNAGAFIHFINAKAHPVVMERGAEKNTNEADPTRWGANGLIKIQGPEPGLGNVFKTAQVSKTIKWLRWELVNGKPAAVFSFNVPSEKSGLDVHVCCFPAVRQAGVARFYSATAGRQMAGQEATSSGGGVAGNFQTNTEWHDFKSSTPYHGRLLIDPESGIVLRLIVEAELKTSDVVHQMDTRIDYGPIKISQSTFVLPVRTMVNTVVVPNGESGAGGYSTRTTLFTSEYSDYRPAPAK